MEIELVVPAVGESITEVEIGAWLKNEGEAIQKDQPVAALETEKATVELPAPSAGVLSRIIKQRGESAKVGETIGIIAVNGKVESAAPEKKPARATTPSAEPAAEKSAASPAQAEAAPAARPSEEGASHIMPAAARLLAEHGLAAEQVTPTGPGKRILKEDVLRLVDDLQKQKTSETKPATPAAPTAPAGGATKLGKTDSRPTEVVPMSRLRRAIAERLVQAQHTTASLTTFNEVDLSAIIALRKEFQESFTEKHKVKLGFMSFFVKASVEALKQIPQVNAEVRGTDIVYHNYYDIGVAIGGGKGLVVPVLRNAHTMSFADIEKAIADFAARARENKLTLEELQGGTFTISNGGVYGSMLSTPILNPPQSGILGMHAIQERPVAREGAVVIRPMMYLALTYDHRIVDGREAVTFLKTIKELIENPARILLEI